MYDYARPRARRARRPVPDDPTIWTVTDDWPEDVPVTEAEIEVFEAWFGDLFDELLWIGTGLHRPRRCGVLRGVRRHAPQACPLTGSRKAFLDVANTLAVQWST